MLLPRAKALTLIELPIAIIENTDMAPPETIFGPYPRTLSELPKFKKVNAEQFL